MDAAGPTNTQDSGGPAPPPVTGDAVQRQDAKETVVGTATSGVERGLAESLERRMSNGATKISPAGSQDMNGSRDEAAQPSDSTAKTDTMTTHLPSPLPSPRRASNVTNPSQSPLLARYSTSLSRFPPLDTNNLGRPGPDEANGIPSCAVSESDTDVYDFAVETSTDGQAVISSAQAKPRKELGATLSAARGTRDRSGTKSSNDHGSVRRLSASKIQELTAAPESLPVAPFPEPPMSAGVAEAVFRIPALSRIPSPPPAQRVHRDIELGRSSDIFAETRLGRALPSERPKVSSRTLSNPAQYRRPGNSQSGSAPFSPRRNTFQPSVRPIPANFETNGHPGHVNTPKTPAAEPLYHRETRESQEQRDPRSPSPMPPAFPIPPLSAPTFLQLELAAQRPSPLYVYKSAASDIPYESSAIKFERLKNFLLLAPFLERTLVIGALACLDAWLWTLTILPIRFCLAAKVLVSWWGYVIAKEIRWLVDFVWEGVGRLWQRARTNRDPSRRPSLDSRRSSEAREPLRDISANEGTSSTNLGGIHEAPMRRTKSDRADSGQAGLKSPPFNTRRSRHGPFHHKRAKSIPSNLSSFHKADLLQFAVIIVSSLILTHIDASRMYHVIRAQSAVKLYVIYNLIEVGDRLLSALGQDIFECLFSSEVLSRNSLGRSKVLLPFFMFCLALAYNCAHAITLFYQVIALNVAVNSYSNALLTLLMSNQFVEIKGSVFKRFEKENLFQLTCADVVERFQLWIVLLIIGMRNVVEVGGLSVPGSGVDLGAEGVAAKVPLHNPSILPMSFTILPSWLWSGEVLSPFLVVVFSEMLVDWIKHAYINKFNNIKPNFYSRILDILCKDYYTNAFVTPTLTRRLGLPLIPLSTLFIRASFQTYHMFLATHMPAPLSPSSQTSLSVESTAPTSPAVTAALDRLDHVIRHALGRSVYGLDGDAAGASSGNTTSTSGATKSWFSWTTDDAIALITLVLVVFIVWLALLIVKLFLGMLLLRYSRNRYASMKLKEHAVAAGKADKESFDAKGKRIGGFGAVEIGDDRRRWVYGDDKEGLKKARDRERKMEEKRDKGGDGDRDLSGVMRYEMVAKRIW